MMTKNESKKKGRYHVKGTTKKGKKEGKEEEEEKTKVDTHGPLTTYKQLLCFAL